MDNRLHLPDKYRRQVAAVFALHLPGVEVWVYGSRINGRSHDGSDLDLAVRAPGLTRIADSKMRDLSRAFSESNIPFLVEARDWAALPDSFHREIEKDYVVLATTV